ncbi:MAG: intermembrane phospholipid transport protein YdbH family protein, partial [Thermodesulfobacteriota bacterium]
VLERIVLGQMRDLGIEQPRVTVEALRPGRIALSGLGGDNLALEAQTVVLHLSLQGLMQGRADLLQISGLQWKLSWAQGGLDWGLPSFPDRDTRSDNTLPLPPVEKVQLSSSYLLLEHSGFSWPLPLQGSLALQEEKDLQLLLQTSLLGVPLQMQGQADLSKGNIEIQGSLPGTQGLDLQLPDTGSTVKGGLEFAWEQELQGTGKGKFQLALQSREQGWQAQGLGLEQGEFRLCAEMDQALQVSKLDADLHLSGLRFQDYLLSSLDVQLSKSLGQLDLQMALQEPAELELALQGEQNDVNHLLSQDRSWSGSWGYELQGSLPRELLNKVAGLEALGSPALPFQAEGRLESRINPGAKGRDWQLEAQGQSTSLGPADLSLPGHGVDLQGVHFQGPVQVVAGNGQLQVRAKQGSSLGIDAGRLSREEEKYLLQGLLLTSRGSGPWAEYLLEPDGQEKLVLDLQMQDSLQLDGADFRLIFPSPGLRGSLQKKADEPAWQGALRAKLGQGSIELPEHDLRLQDIALDLPLVLGSVQHQPGSFNIGQVKARGNSWPGPTGTLLAQDRQLQMQGKWQLLPGLGLDLDLSLALQENGPQGELQAWSDWFQLPGTEEFTTLIPELQELDLELEGLAKINMQADLRGTELNPYLELEVQDVDALLQDKQVQLQGLSGRLALDSFFPLQTARDKGTYVEFSELQAKDLVLQAGHFLFRLQNETLFLDSGSCKLDPEGEVSIYQGSWDLTQAQGSARIYLQEIDALQILADQTQGKLEGSGLFSGNFHLGWGREGLNLYAGNLYALPGTGRLGIKDEEWLEALLFYVRESMAEHEYLSLLSERLEEALRDFEYDFFSLRLLPQEDGVLARMELRGQGVKGDPPQQVGSLVLNINDVQQAMNQVLRFQLGREGAVQEALEELFRPGS